MIVCVCYITAYIRVAHKMNNNTIYLLIHIIYCYQLFYTSTHSYTLYLILYLTPYTPPHISYTLGARHYKRIQHYCGLWQSGARPMLYLYA